MTLISYPTRVHFADDILQEALHSELERTACKMPLLVYENHLIDSDTSERILDGLPRKMQPQTLTFPRSSDLSRTCKSTVFDLLEPDVIIAFGSSRAIELGRKCRYALTQTYGRRPALFAAPGVDGLPGPCTRNLESWRAGLPSVLICDPTVTLGADPTQSLRTAVLSLVRCVESYLANAYNPPADGMALDGLGRCVSNLPKASETTSLDRQREMMAANLNAALSQEKGIGPALTLAEALAATDKNLDVSDLSSLILPSMINQGAVDLEKADMLLKVVGGPETELDLAMFRLFEGIPLARSLSALGVNGAALDHAATKSAGKAGLDYEKARSVLEAVY